MRGRKNGRGGRASASAETASAETYMWWRHGQMGLSSHETGDPKISVIARKAWNGGERKEKSPSPQFWPCPPLPLPALRPPCCDCTYVCRHYCREAASPAGELEAENDLLLVPHSHPPCRYLRLPSNPVTSLGIKSTSRFFIS